MTDHVSSVCRASYYHFQNIRSLKPFLSEEALVTVVHAFVTYRIDYGHSLYMGYLNTTLIAFGESKTRQLAC
jgi:hypothetical protein